MNISFLLVSRSISKTPGASTEPNRSGSSTSDRFGPSKKPPNWRRSGHSNQRSFWIVGVKLQYPLAFGKTWRCCGEKSPPFWFLKAYKYKYTNKFTYHIYTSSKNQNFYTHLQKWSIWSKPAIFFFLSLIGSCFFTTSSGCPWIGSGL